MRYLKNDVFKNTNGEYMIVSEDARYNQKGEALFCAEHLDVWAERRLFEVKSKLEWINHILEKTKNL